MENERLVFKFYKSYFDTAKLLDDKNRLAFYDALLEKQFNFIEPTLSGLAELVYVSQKHNIDSQVNGWLEKMKSMGIEPPITPPIVPPSIQIKKKEEVKDKKEKETCFSFDDFWGIYSKSADKEKCKKVYAKLSEQERADIKMKLPLYLKTITDKKFQKNPLTYLNGKCWNDIEIQQITINNQIKVNPYL